MDRRTSAVLVELEEQLVEEGVPEDAASDFVDRIEREIEDLLLETETDEGEEKEDE